MKTVSGISAPLRTPRALGRLLAAGLLSSGLALAGVNEPANNATASSVSNTPSVATPQYTDRGTTTVTVTRDYSPGFTGSYYPNSFPHRFDSGFYSGPRTSSVTVQHRPIYFPPNPPALGEPFKRRDPVSFARFSPPATLAHYVYEPFYAPLSTLLFTEDLSRKRRERLDAYRATRTTLLTELRAKIESLRSADADARERDLAAFAREQAAPLAALNATADELRSHFTHGGFFDSNVNWNDSREWRLGDDTRWESQVDEIKVLRASAAFQDGLSLAQRRLLREIAMELADSLTGPTTEIALDSPGPFLYFSPATSRIRLAADIPAALSAKIDAYKTAKATLKSELRDTLYNQDRAWFDYKRVAALKALAERQVAPLAALENLAEEIRRDLVPYPNPARPPEMILPASMAPQIRAYHQQKVALQNLLVAKLDEVRTALPDDRVEYTRVSDNYVLSVIPNRRATPAQVAKRQTIVATLPAFNQNQSQLYAKLAREKEAIHREVIRVASALSAKSTSKTIEQLLREFAYAFQKQEAWEVYREYETAVLEPGLSPAQRELLFGAALEKLELPLSE